MRVSIQKILTPVLLIAGLSFAQPTVKSVFVIRIDFRDKPGEVISAADAKTVIDETVADFFMDNSNGRIRFEATVTDKILRMPEESSAYTGTKVPTKLRSNARGRAFFVCILPIHKGVRLPPAA